MDVGDFTQNTYGDYYLDSVNKGAFNQLGAAVFYQNYFSEFFAKEQQFYLIIGTDAGLLPLFLSQQPQPKESCYLFIDTAEVLEKIKTLPYYEAINDQCRFATLEAWYETAQQQQLWSYLALDQVRVIQSVAAMDDHLSCYRVMSETVEQVIDQEAWKARTHFAGHMFATVQFKNLTENHTPAIIFQDQALGKKALLLAGGPSLDEHLDFIKQHRSQLFLVAVSRISQRLYELGIVPDMLVCIDPTEKMFSVSKAALSFHPLPILAHGYAATHLLVGAWPGPQVYIGKRFLWNTPKDVDNVQVLGPTVTNTAIQLLLAMGFKTIYLCGVDLSYSLAGFTHAKGSMEYQAGPRLDYIGKLVELNDGTYGETDSAFSFAITMLREQAIHAKTLECTLYNVSAKAARIEGIEYRALDTEALEQDAPALLSRIRACFDEQSQQHQNNHYRDCLAELYDIKKRVYEFNYVVKKALMLMKQLPQTHQQQKIDHLLEKINQDSFEVMDIVKFNGYRYLEDVFKFVNTEKTKEDIFLATKAYLTGYSKSSVELMDMMQEAISRIKARQQEHLEKPNYTMLLSQWQKDRTYYRSVSWIMDKALSMPPEVLKKFQDMAVQAALFDTKDPAKPHGECWDNLRYRKSVVAKLEHLFKLKDLERLRVIASYIESQSHPEAMNIYQFAKGLLAELAVQDEQAIECFHASAKNDCMELALNHLTVVLLKKGDTQNALHALECLAHLSPGYQAHYEQLKKVLVQETTTL
jgi:hypothetical protein